MKITTAACSVLLFGFMTAPVLAGEKSTVEVETRNMTADEVLGVMSQENLTALMAPLKGK